MSAPAKTVRITPPTPNEIKRVAQALYAARGIKMHGSISPWRGEDTTGTRQVWEGLAIAAIDMCNGAAARL